MNSPNKVKSRTFSVDVERDWGEEPVEPVFHGVTFPMNIEGLDSYTTEELKKAGEELAVLAINAGILNDPKFISRGMSGVCFFANVFYDNDSAGSSRIGGVLSDKNDEVLLLGFQTKILEY